MFSSSGQYTSSFSAAIDSAYQGASRGKYGGGQSEAHDELKKRSRDLRVDSGKYCPPPAPELPGVSYQMPDLIPVDPFDKYLEPEQREKKKWFKWPRGRSGSRGRERERDDARSMPDLDQPAPQYEVFEPPYVSPFVQAMQDQYREAAMNYTTSSTLGTVPDMGVVVVSFKDALLTFLRNMGNPFEKCLQVSSNDVHQYDDFMTQDALNPHDFYHDDAPFQDPPLERARADKGLYDMDYSERLKELQQTRVLPSMTKMTLK